MKKCPYCAEEIQDAAIKCRYCHSVLTAPTPGDPAMAASPRAAPAPAAFPSPAIVPPAQAQPAFEPHPGGQVGEGALRFSHTGRRYILGYGADFFGIWDRNAPGGPVSSYPRDDAGWTQSWNQFTVWEPRAMAVPRATAPPDTRWAPAKFRSGHGLALPASILLGVYAVLQAIAIAFRAQELGLLHRIQEGRFVSDAEVHAADGHLHAMLTLLLLTEAAIVVLWLMWQFRAQSNLHSLGAEALKYTPGWSVGWWFVPFANFAMPYLTMRELMLASSPEMGALDWKARRAPALLVAWWAAWLAPIIAAGIGSPASFTKTPTTGQVIMQETWGIVAAAISILAAVFAILVLRRIDGMQASKWGRVSTVMLQAGAAA